MSEMSETLTRRNGIVCAAHQLVTRRIAELMQERAQLEEEVRQLQAAVRIWTALAEQTSLPGSQRTGKRPC